MRRVKAGFDCPARFLPPIPPPILNLPILIRSLTRHHNKLHGIRRPYSFFNLFLRFPNVQIRTPRSPPELVLIGLSASRHAPARLGESFRGSEEHGEDRSEIKGIEGGEKIYGKRIWRIGLKSEVEAKEDLWKRNGNARP